MQDFFATVLHLLKRGEKLPNKKKVLNNNILKVKDSYTRPLLNQLLTIFK